MLLMAATVTVTYSNPYSNADALNIVVQHEKEDEILMCACAVSPGRKI